jgi:hypothetical protein
VRDRLVGRWRLAAYEAVSDEASIQPMGAGALGVLDYSADGKVSVHMMRRGAEGYFAYYGNYLVDESRSTVTHQLEMASEPSFVGASNLRHAKLEGRTLTLSGSMTIEGKPHTIRVLWERDSAP